MVAAKNNSTTVNDAEAAENRVHSYNLREQIGIGGFGEVWRAEQPIGQHIREVAVKVIRPEFINDPDFIRQFEVEAQIVARLEHPYIVPLHDYWRDPEGVYLVMRYLRGGSLNDLLKKNGHLTLRETVRMVDQIGAALATAHRNGVIHRDLKPQNILMDEDGNTYLSDFGLAKNVGEGGGGGEEENTTGTPAYMAPEQITSDKLTPRTDIYSFGIMLFRVLTGTHPFESTSLSEIITKHLTEAVPRITVVTSHLPTGLDAVIQRATAKNPDDRYANILDLVGAFYTACRSEAEAPAVDSDAAVKSEEFMQLQSWLNAAQPDTQILVPLRNPYKGLRTFDEADAGDFFGRDALIKQLIERLEEETHLARFLAVVGPSGSGKSSVVRAGLLPQIRKGGIPKSDEWFVAQMVPGTDPLQEFEVVLNRISARSGLELAPVLRGDNRGLLNAVSMVLPDENSQLLLVIDQFEEIFTQTTDHATAIHVMKNIYSAVTDPSSQVRIIVTLRADFYDRPLMYPQLGELVSQRTQVVIPLTPDELIDAIARPAENAGLTLQSGLSEAIAEEVGEQPAALPLLQYALTELFERRNGRVLTLDAYEEIGGVQGALARRADEIFQDLTEAQQVAAREIFLRLVTLGEGTEDTRRRIDQSELYAAMTDIESLEAILDLYGKSRLLTFDRDPATREPTVEVAHEALIRQWQRLRGWLENSRADIRLERQLALATSDWNDANRDKSYLLRGSRLAQYEDWSKTTTIALTPDEQTYLKESLAERERIEAEERARQEMELELQRQAARRLRYLLTGAVAFLVVAIGLSVFAFGERQNAQEQAEIADRQADEARSLALAANAEQWNERNQEFALSLAVEANSIPNPPPLARNVLDRLAYQPGADHILTAHQDRIVVVVFSPDGSLVVTGSGDSNARVWNVDTGELRYGITDHTAAVWTVAFSDDGRYLATGSTDTTIMIYDAFVGQSLHTLTGHTGEVRDLHFSPDGTMLLSGSWDDTARLWDVETGELIRVFEGHTDNIFRVDFSPDGDKIATASFDDTARIWDVETGEVLHIFTGHENDIRAMEFTPDGQKLVTGSADSTARVWDVETGELLHILRGHTDWVMGLAISPDGTTVVTGSADTTARLWNIETGELIHIFIGHADRIETLAYSPAGDTILTGCWDTTAKLWAVGSGELLHTFEGHTDTVKSVDFSPTGDLIVTGSLDSNARLWDVSSDELLETYIGHTGPVLSVAFNPAGDRLISGSVDTSARLWNIENGNEIAKFNDHISWVRTATFNHDGTRVVTGSDDFLALVWDIAGRKVVLTLEGHENWVMGAAFSPDDSLIVTGSLDRTARLWDAESGELIRVLEGHEGGILSVAFSPDGKRILTGSDDDTAILWDAETGEIIRVFAGHLDDVFAVTFSPDGTIAATGSADAAVILWNVETGVIMDTLSGHIGDVRALAFNPTGTLLLSGSEDTTTRMWNVQTGELIHTFTGHSGEVTGVAFSPDGQTVATASWDTTVRLWDTNLPEDLVAWTYENWNVPEIPCDQREIYGIEPACDANGIFPTRTPYPSSATGNTGIAEPGS